MRAGNRPDAAGASSGKASAAVAILFPLLVNQGVIYYIARFSLGSELLNPWPVLLATAAASLVAIGSTAVDTKFIRVLFACLMVSVLFGATYLWSPSGGYGLDKTLLTLFVPALCITAGFVVARDGRLRLLLVSGAMLAGLTAIVFTANGHTPALFVESERARGVIITYHNFAFVMALGALWAIDRLWRRLPRADMWALMCLLFFVYFIVLSGGRIGLLLVFLTVLIFLWNGTKGRVLAAILLGACFVIIALIAVVLQSYAREIVLSHEVPATLKRLVFYAFLQREGNVAAGTRDVFYGLAIEVFLRSPLVGVGWGGFPLAAGLTDTAGNWPHNLVLELMAETGIIGTMAFVAFVGAVFYEFIRRRGDVADKNIILAIFTAGFAASMVGGDWPSQRVLFFAMGAMTGFSVKYSSPARLHGRRGGTMSETRSAATVQSA
jgi:O-antigen ligase